MCRTKIDVLDHGYVRLVEHMGSDLSIVRAARVSYDAAWRSGEDAGSDTRLIKRLIRDKHTSPLEAVEFQFEVFAPIFVLRQWHRHRTWSYNELSGRYRELTETFYVPKPENIGRPSKTNKQGRAIIDNIDNEPFDMLVPSIIDACSRACFETYRMLLARGVPRELARIVLPLNVYSHMFAKVDLKNLFHFIELRTGLDAQYEIRVYAEAMLKLAEAVVPITMRAWEDGRA